MATAIRARLAGFKLPDDAVRTMSVDMQPEFDWANGKQTLKGYLATNVIEVRLDDVTQVGDVVDAVIAAGATRVAGVRFTLKDLAGARAAGAQARLGGGARACQGDGLGRGSQRRSGRAARRNGRTAMPPPRRSR